MKPAVAEHPAGNFTDIGHPLVRGIDPTFSHGYLVWKEAPYIRARMLKDDGLAFDDTSQEVELIRNDLPWYALSG